METPLPTASRGRRAIAEILGGLALGAGACLLVLAALGFAFAALYWATVDVLGPGFACLLLVAVALLGAGLLLRSARSLLERPTKPAGPREKGAVIRAYPFESVTVAFVSGVALGVSPESRQTLVAGLRLALREGGWLR